MCFKPLGERAAIETTQLRRALVAGLVPVVAMLMDDPGTTKYLAPGVLRELRVFVDLAYSLLAEDI